MDRLLSILSSITPATWSAAAATFSAITAFIVMLIQRRNYLEVARPELVFTGWSRTQEAKSNRDYIRIATLRNVGCGPALNVMTSVNFEEIGRPAAVMSSFRSPILAAGESVDFDGDITLWWAPQGTPVNPRATMVFDIRIYCWDARNRRHETIYTLVVIPVSQHRGLSQSVAPGVMIHHRATHSTPVCQLRLIATANRPIRLPGFLRRKHSNG